MQFQSAILAVSLALVAWQATVAIAEAPTPGPSAGEAKHPITADEREFFEASIRPVLVAKCYSCHSAEAKTLRGDLHLDSRAGVATGGATGAVINGNDPDTSTLIQAVRWTDPYLQMPPTEKLTDREIASLERWVQMGAPDPREAVVATIAAKQIDIAAGRQSWSFQPVAQIEPPALPNDAWSKNRIDRFVIAKLNEGQIASSPKAERDMLLRRAYLDLTGLRPTFDEVQAIVNDNAPDAYERVIDKLLAMPQHDERWGRYWLDVVRYGEDNFRGKRPRRRSRSPGVIGIG